MQTQRLSVPGPHVRPNIIPHIASSASLVSQRQQYIQQTLLIREFWMARWRPSFVTMLFQTEIWKAHKIPQVVITTTWNNISFQLQLLDKETQKIQWHVLVVYEANRLRFPTVIDTFGKLFQNRFIDIFINIQLCVARHTYGVGLNMLIRKNFKNL